LELCSSHLRPSAEQNGQVRRADNAVAVEIRGAASSPRSKQNPEVRRADNVVTVEIGGLWWDLGIANSADLLSNAHAALVPCSAATGRIGVANGLTTTFIVAAKADVRFAAVAARRAIVDGRTLRTFRKRFAGFAQRVTTHGAAESDRALRCDEINARLIPSGLATSGISGANPVAAGFVGASRAQVRLTTIANSRAIVYRWALGTRWEGLTGLANGVTANGRAEASAAGVACQIHARLIPSEGTARRIDHAHSVAAEFVRTTGTRVRIAAIADTRAVVYRRTFGTLWIRLTWFADGVAADRPAEFRTEVLRGACAEAVPRAFTTEWVRRAHRSAATGVLASRSIVIFATTPCGWAAANAQGRVRRRECNDQRCECRNTLNRIHDRVLRYFFTVQEVLSVRDAAALAHLGAQYRCSFTIAHELHARAKSCHNGRVFRESPNARSHETNRDSCDAPLVERGPAKACRRPLHVLANDRILVPNFAVISGIAEVRCSIAA